jgi:acetyl-CoA carboxylase carboxyltransferase component
MIAVMGSEQLAGVMEMVSRQSAKKQGVAFDEEQAAQMKQYMKGEIEKQSNALFASGQLWDDGIMDPRETRNYLSVCLAVIYQQEIKSDAKYGVFRM